ncbi:MAG: F0F1 ATP synthase subunit gamma [Candidatus Peribacteria bacterium]|nr:F0F1 ATP synthase subunit gamma [Candidatus Peribacteria bacterium]
MEVASTAKLQKYKHQTDFFKEFFYRFLHVLNYVQKQISIRESDMLDTYPDGKRLLMVITADKGLAGGITTNVLKRVQQAYGHRKEKADIIAIGKKGEDYFLKNGRNVVASLHPKDKITSGEFVELYQYLRSAIYEKKYSKVKIYFNFYKNSLIQRPSRITLFPLTPETLEEFIKEIELKSPVNRKEFKEMLIEPDLDTYRDHIIQYLLENILYYTILNAKISEHASRMVAMKHSKDNCSDLADRLTRAYNKSRQMKITQEITEIVSTKSAIEGN